MVEVEPSKQAQSRRINLRCSVGHIGERDCCPKTCKAPTSYSLAFKPAPFEKRKKCLGPYSWLRAAVLSNKSKGSSDMLLLDRSLLWYFIVNGEEKNDRSIAPATKSV